MRPVNKPSSVAIVTGAGTGVGAATARMLASQGYGVVINYNRSADLAEQVLHGRAVADDADVFSVGCR